MMHCSKKTPDGLSPCPELPLYKCNWPGQGELLFCHVHKLEAERHALHLGMEHSVQFRALQTSGLERAYNPEPGDYWREEDGGSIMTLYRSDESIAAKMPRAIFDEYVRPKVTIPIRECISDEKTPPAS